MSRALLIAGLLVAPALFAQTSIYTPEIHLGGANQPSTITVPPVVQLSAEPAEPQVSNAPPASTALLSSRHFDFIVSLRDSREYGRWFHQPRGIRAPTSRSTARGESQENSAVPGFS
jgi:hypothetical protein